MTTKFNANIDYKTAFAAEVDALWATDINARIGELQAHLKRLKKDLEEAEKTKATKWALLALPYEIGECERTIQCEFERKTQIAANLTEAYVCDTGERPDARQLDRMATWLLKGAEHGDIDAEVLTAPQRYRRKKRELPDMLIDGKIMNDDGNTYREPKPSMDEKGSHFEYVRMPSDNEDKRKFNGPMRRYNVNFNGKK